MDGARRAKIAIIGAGPVGLWLAVLIGRETARINATSSGIRIDRLPHSPKIDIYERRKGKGQYGTRKFVLAISTATQDLLNRCLSSDQGLQSHHAFAPSCSINLIESLLFEEYKKYSRAGFGKIFFGARIDNPEDLFYKYDVVIVA